MLQPNFIKENKEMILEALKKRSFKEVHLLDEIINLDQKRKDIQSESDNLKSEENKSSKEIGKLFGQKKVEEAKGLQEQVKGWKIRRETLKIELDEVKTKLENALFSVPNVPHPSVPAGSTDDDNEVFQDWNKDFPKLHEGHKPHWELMKDYNIVSLELGVKVTGAGFPVYIGKGAKLQRALIAFFLDEAEKAGYLEYMTPYMVNEASARGTGQLPDKEGQMYHDAADDLYLIPTAEVPVTNIYRDVIVNEKDFPIKMTAYTPCFRREAGSYGAHVRGLNRLHQFDKVEIVRLEHPEKSYEALEEMVDYVGGLLEKLGLPYRILRLCGGDLGFTSALTFDFETYSTAQGRWLEVSSISNFENFQSNRLKLRYKDANNKKHLAHTLNGSALALPRIVATILENYQTPEGIVIPEVLRPYTRFDIID
ncbi:MAG: seryl-tRNA synthetase [Maribacter sp.]|jgi:seryl-tRNA synthetase